jgi:glycogen phosphorylase
MIYPLYHRPQREIIKELEGLSDLALDLRWTWSHFSDRLWEFLDPETWERTRNPYYIMQSVSRSRLKEVAKNENFKQELRGWMEKQRQYLNNPGWFGKTHAQATFKRAAYFSMEFGLGEALPIYSGGLGILAGDYLKTASDLCVPTVGIGLLYQQGYFRQVLSTDGWQLEAFPYNDPTILPVIPVEDQDGGILRIKIELPGRTVLLRVWQAFVGKVTLYLLDSNDPLNSPWDRGITANLYPAEKERRLIQEVVLGLGGWLALEKLRMEVDVCHLNEGHAAFAVLERAHSCMRKTGQPFSVALRATRAGNVFTTHTPVEAAFDRFEPGLIKPYLQRLAEVFGISLEELLPLGRKDPKNLDEPFNMAYLAMHGSCHVNGVSLLHGKVSRKIFQVLYPRWPQEDVPVGHITNGVHMPSWDSQAADQFWTTACGKERWLAETEILGRAIEGTHISDLWNLRAVGRLELVQYVRQRLVRQLQGSGAPSEKVKQARHVLDPDVLTLGFARRFTAYKRPTLLLHDPERLTRILLHPKQPVQLVVAGKAHPKDEEGKRMVQAMAKFASRPEIFDHVVFLEDYDMTLAQHIAAGVDVWINNPRRPWEACGTSGMKVLVNGGVNLSELDGWWAEAFTSDVGWALGDGQEHTEYGWDAHEADQLYSLLEQHIVPEFYTRDQDNIPREWVERIRKSMARLTPHFSGNRMVREYVEKLYLPAAEAYRERTANGGKVAAELEQWHRNLAENWKGLRFGEVRVFQEENDWRFEAQVYCGDIDPEQLNVEIYAEPRGGETPSRAVMKKKGSIPGTVNGYLYVGDVPTAHPSEHYSLRIIPCHPNAHIPIEAAFILWQR